MIAGLAVVFAAFRAIFDGFRHRRGIDWCVSGRGLGRFNGWDFGGRCDSGLDIAQWTFVSLARFVLSLGLRFEIGGGRR